jgi:hypothetical protein
MLNGSLSRKTWLACLALGVGLLATVFASLQVKQDIEQEAVRQFAFTCDQVILKIQRAPWRLRADSSRRWRHFCNVSAADFFAVHCAKAKFYNGF